MPIALTRFLLFAMIFLSIAIAMHAFGFQLRLSGDPGFHQRFDQLPVASTMHVIGGGLVLLVGGFQFWSALRRARPILHRWLGRIYLSMVAVGGIGGLILAPFSAGGLVAHFGFGLLAVLWLFSGWRAYAAIRAGDIVTHQHWMMRNFAMAFGAVTLRIYLGALMASGYGFDEAYPTVAWISWVPNLLLVEWYLAIRGESRRPARAPSPLVAGTA